MARSCHYLQFQSCSCKVLSHWKVHICRRLQTQIWTLQRQLHFRDCINGKYFRSSKINLAATKLLLAFAAIKICNSRTADMRPTLRPHAAFAPSDLLQVWQQPKKQKTKNRQFCCRKVDLVSVKLPPFSQLQK